MFFNFLYNYKKVIQIFLFCSTAIFNIAKISFFIYNNMNWIYYFQSLILRILKIYIRKINTLKKKIF